MLQIKHILLKVSILSAFCLLIGITTSQAANLTVTTTADSGPGSFRQALLDATANAEANIITFNIPPNASGNNDQKGLTIALLSPLPDIPVASLTINNPQAQSVNLVGNGTFRILTLVDSAVVTINNLSIMNGSSSGGIGGGILMGNSSTMTLNNCTVSGNNVAASGGGIFMSSSSTLHLNRTTVRDNSAASGGGIYIFDSGTLNMIGDTLVNNSATNGGGIYNGTSGTVNTTSSTMDGNHAVDQGGAIYNGATLTAINNTFSANSAEIGGGIYNAFTATLINNIVATNTATTGNDLFGAFSGTYNLIGNVDDSTGVVGAPNRTGTTLSPLDPMLGPLQSNGGPTLTRSPIAGSPAIDKGNSATVVTDQRGEVDPVDNPAISNDGGNGADMGAVEVQLAPTAAGVTVGGRVFVQLGGSRRRALVDATAKLISMNGGSQTTPTDSLGHFQFDNVPTGETYIVSIQSRRYTFQPKVFSLVEDLSDLEFVYTAPDRRIQVLTTAIPNDESVFATPCKTLSSAKRSSLSLTCK